MILPHLTFVALVDVHVAGGPDEPGRAGAGVAAGDHVGLADGARAAGVAGAGVVQVAEQARLAGRTLAVVVGNSVVAGAAVQAGIRRAVVHVQLAVATLVTKGGDAKRPLAKLIGKILTM